MMDQRGNHGSSQSSFYSTGFKKSGSPEKNLAEETSVNVWRQANLAHSRKKLSGEEKNLLILLEKEIINEKLTIDILFEKFDINHDNLINLQEFNQGLKGLGLNLSSEDLILFFKLFDITNSGVISFENFQEVLMRKKNHSKDNFFIKKNSEELQGDLINYRSEN